MERASVFFFDIGDTLGAVTFNGAGDRIERIDVFPNVTDILRKLHERGARLGIISNRGEIPEENVLEALASAGLLSFFNTELILFGRKDSTEIFMRAARMAGHVQEPGKCLFVGENERERGFAAAAGMLVAESPEALL